MVDTFSLASHLGVDEGGAGGVWVAAQVDLAQIERGAVEARRVVLAASARCLFFSAGFCGARKAGWTRLLPLPDVLEALFIAAAG